MPRPHTLFPRLALRRWFRRNARAMPWRGTRDPYRIWVSEVMLQQTRVGTVRRYYGPFLRSFPSIRALARASLPRVLAAWSGLGYYGRARSLHAAAKIVAASAGGRLPRDAEQLRQLPGFGRYTAGAVASIAFGAREPVVDGNVARVLARWHGWRGDPTEAAAMQRAWAVARPLVPAAEPGDWNQALMELGALACTPRTPECEGCPISASCRAAASGDPERFGARERRGPVPRSDRFWLLVRDSRGRIALGERPPRGIWGGLVEPPAGDGPGNRGVAARSARARFGAALARPVRLGSRFEHAFTHRRVTFHVYEGSVKRPVARPGLIWVRPPQALRLALPAPLRRLVTGVKWVT